MPLLLVPALALSIPAILAAGVGTWRAAILACIAYIGVLGVSGALAGEAVGGLASSLIWCALAFIAVGARKLISGLFAPKKRPA